MYFGNILSIFYGNLFVPFGKDMIFYPKEYFLLLD